MSSIMEDDEVEFPFPTLGLALLEPNLVQPEDIDELGDEISQALQRCSVSESQISQHERKLNERMMQCIFTIDIKLSTRAKSSMDSRDGALLLLFRKTVITPANLQALFRMSDPQIRTGSVRCIALWHLKLLGSITSSWSLLIPGENEGNGNGDPTPPSTKFGLKQIEVFCNAVMHKGHFCFDVADPCGPCSRNPWRALAGALMRAVTALPLNEVLELLNKYNWSQILQGYMDVDKEFLDEQIFLPLHALASRLLVQDANNQMAKTFLQVQLGSCQRALLHKFLTRIVSGEIYSFNSTGFSRLNEITSWPRTVFLALISCFVPVPVDQETHALVRRARVALAAAYNMIVISETENYSIPLTGDEDKRLKLQKLIEMIGTMDQWQDLHDQTDEVRWEQSLDFIRQRSSDRFVMNFRKRAKESFKASCNIDDGEMCACCFVLEKRLLLDESNQAKRLMKCSRCHQLKYCSRNCQVKHWKKAHKKHCKTVSG